MYILVSHFPSTHVKLGARQISEWLSLGYLSDLCMSGVLLGSIADDFIEFTKYLKNKKIIEERARVRT